MGAILATATGAVNRQLNTLPQLSSCRWNAG
jgi:hypothetical protein